MSTIEDGTVSLTEGSDIVSGSGTTFTTTATKGMGFVPLGSPFAYQIVQVIDDLTLKILPPFKTKTGNLLIEVPFCLQKGYFTPILDLPLPTPNDLDSASILRRVFMAIDRELPPAT